MKKQNGESENEDDGLRDHYDFDYSRAKPNRFADKFSEDTVVIVLDPDVASAFPTAQAVNEALRLVMKLSTIPEARVQG
jgi:hypothetical protein